MNREPQGPLPGEPSATALLANVRSVFPLGVSLLFSTLVLTYLTARNGAAASLGVAALVGIITVMVLRPDLATLAVVWVLYLNLMAIAVKELHLPESVAAMGVLPLSLPLIYHLVLRRERIKIGRPLILMGVFLVCLLLSSFVAKDHELAAQGILTYVFEGLLLFFLVYNVIRDLRILKRVMWVLVLGAAFLGSLTLYQAVTGSYTQRFGGLAQRELSFEEAGAGDRTAPREEMRVADRASGSIGDPNRYAQNELMILPFALFLLWYERSQLRKLMAAGSAMLILAAVVLSYSRGAFLTLAALLLLLVMRQRRRRWSTLGGAALLLVLLVAVAPGYRGRLGTLLGVEGLFSAQASEQPDGATRGRTTEMLAAVHVFLDHPILGVGPEQYTPFYSMAYHMNPETAFRYLPKTRRAHSLYAEMAAETGLLGLTVFLSLAGWLLCQLWQASRRWALARPDLANLATTFFFSIVAYLGTAVFLHLSYERYYWLLLALASAGLHIGSAEYHSMRRLNSVSSFPQGRQAQ
jgi:O-antigen ligase